MEINTIEDLERLFPDEQSCRKYIHEIRWGQWAQCVYCGNPKCYIIENGERYKCANASCKKRFFITVKTLMEASKLTLAQWMKAFFYYAKSRGRISSFELSENIRVTHKTEFYLREKLEFIWKDVERIGKTNEEIIIQIIKAFCNSYIQFEQVKNARFYKSPYHIEGIDNIGDPKQYNMLVRHIRYYMNVYATWIWIDFTTPTDVMSELFIYLADNKIKEYNTESILRAIWATISKMWSRYLNESPKFHQYQRRYNKQFKVNQRLNMTTGYLVQAARATKEGKKMTAKEVRNDKELLERTKERILERRNKQKKLTEFNSHFD